jgi:transposase
VTDKSVSAATAPRPVLDDVRAQARDLLAAGHAEQALDLVLSVLARTLDDKTRLELDRARLLRKHLGQTSEKVSSAQLSLLTALLSGQAPEPTAVPPLVELPPVPDKPKGSKKGHGRSRLPENLERRERIHAVPEAERGCPTCGDERRCIGYETSETLERIPARFSVEVHKREKLACGTCDEGVVTAPTPDKVIEKGRPGPGLLADVFVGKYADHLPLNRQRSLYKREGVDLPVTTLVDWIAAIVRSVEPVTEYLARRVLTAYVVHADDTGIKVLDGDAPRGAKRGHLWCYVGVERDGETCAAFRYAPDWKADAPRAFLDERVGWLVADAYKGYDALFTRANATAVEVGCWAHAPRPFAELVIAQDARAAPILELIRELYEVERRATEDRDDADARLRRRIEWSAPRVDHIVERCREIRQTCPPSEPLAKGAGYILNQEQALRRFLEDGHVPIDNTLVERRLRPVAIGRKNYLFAGSDAGAERAAAAYTLLGNCALAGVNPRAYLVWLLSKLELERFPMSRIGELVPQRFALVCSPDERVPTSR